MESYTAYEIGKVYHKPKIETFSQLVLVSHSHFVHLSEDGSGNTLIVIINIADGTRNIIELDIQYRYLPHNLMCITNEYIALCAVVYDNKTFVIINLLDLNYYKIRNNISHVEYISIVDNILHFGANKNFNTIDLNDPEHKVVKFSEKNLLLTYDDSNWDENLGPTGNTDPTWDNINLGPTGNTDPTWDNINLGPTGNTNQIDQIDHTNNITSQTCRFKYRYTYGDSLGITDTTKGLLFCPIMVDNHLTNFECYVVWKGIFGNNPCIGYHHVITSTEKCNHIIHDYNGNMTELKLVDTEGNVVSNNSYNSWQCYSDMNGVSIWISDMKTPYLYRRFYLSMRTDKNARK